MLNDMIGRVEQTQLTEKDPEAEQLLNQRLGRNPNALYILSQTVLVQKYALEQAQAQLDQLRQQTQALQQQPAHTTSFLGSLLGHRDPAPPPPPPTSTTGLWGTALCPPYAQPWNQGASYGPPPPMPGGGSSFLRTAATTAAGVAAGALAFQGVESLLGGFGHSAGFGGMAAVAGCSAAARRAGQRKPSSTITTMTPAVNTGVSTIPGWEIAAAMPRTCSKQVTTCGTTGIIRMI